MLQPFDCSICAAHHAPDMQEDWDELLEIVKDVQQICQELYPRSFVEVMGSMSKGVFCPKTSLDLVLRGVHKSELADTPFPQYEHQEKQHANQTL